MEYNNERSDEKLIKVSTSKTGDVTNSTKEDFFSKPDNSSISPSKDKKQVEDVNKLIEYIRKNQPVSMWQICKETGIPNSSLYYKIRDLEFAHVIFSKIIINENNRSVRMIYTAGGGEK